MKTKIEFNDVTETWFKAIKDLDKDDEIYIFTPYLTGSVVKDLFNISVCKNFKLITKLDVHACISGSLDLEELKTIIDMGGKIFHQPNLHAKILLTKKKIILGSQNFTTGGRHNLEAFTSNELNNKESQRLRKKATDLILSASLLSKAVIDEFKNICDPVTTDYLNAIKKITAVEDIIEKKGILDSPSKSLNESIEKFRTVADNVDNYVYTYLTERGEEYYEYWTIKRANEWQTLNTFSLSKIVLRPRKKYLCLDLSTHSTFIIKANKTQIGQVYDSGDIYIYNPKYPGYRYRVLKITCLTPNENAYLANLKLEFSNYHKHIISDTAPKILENVSSIYIYFTGSNFIIRGIEKSEHKEGLEDIEFLVGGERFNQIKRFLKPKLKKYIFKELRVSKSSIYASPERFFNPYPEIQLGVSEYRGEYFYIINQVKL